MPEKMRSGTKPAAVVRAAELTGLISGYLDHLQDQAYVSSVFSRAPMAEVGAVLVSMLRSGERESAANADLFVQDALMFGLSPAFALYFPRSPVLRALRDNLSAADYFTRHQCIHTLRRIGPRSNARYLAAAFAWYLEHDAFNLDDLLDALFSLSRSTHREPYLVALSTAPLYLARWAIVGHLLDHGSYMQPGLGERMPPQLLGFLGKLARDPHPWVCAEATWRLAKLKASGDSWNANGLEGTDEPMPTFFTLELHVGNYLAISGRRDYDITLVERIGAYVRMHPPSAGLDLDAYWASFASFRA